MTQKWVFYSSSFHLIRFFHIFQLYWLTSKWCLTDLILWRCFTLKVDMRFDIWVTWFLKNTLESRGAINYPETQVTFCLKVIIQLDHCQSITNHWNYLKISVMLRSQKKFHIILCNKNSYILIVNIVMSIFFLKYWKRKSNIEI